VLFGRHGVLTGMSDFDREAERERLREQFEEDKQKREQSERMSELLLKGATMTNVHCDRCGDPIFRWDGQEFCPTCQGDPGGEPAATPSGDEPATSDHQPTQPQRTPQASDTQPTPNDAGSTVEVEPERPADQMATDSPAADQPTDTDRTPARERQPRRVPAETASEATDDLAAARASLGRTLATLAEQAERSDDLSRTREYLTAAKEAAEALDAAEQVR